MDKITIWGGIECVRGDESEDSTQNNKKGSCIVTGKDLHASDGYHTFDELYDHRITLFIALCRLIEDRISENQQAMLGREVEHPHRPWRSKTHHDGSAWDGWFILGIFHFAGKQISYHLPLSRWDETDFAETLDKAPEWDGHTSADVLERLKAL